MKHLWPIVACGFALSSLTLFLRGVAILVQAEEIEPYKPQDPPTILVHQRIVMIPSFPALAPEIIEVPDAGPDDAGRPEWQMLNAELRSVTWFPATPWLSTVTILLPNQYGEDPDPLVYSMMDCYDSAPCNVVKNDWRIVGIGPSRIKLLHVPSGVDAQTMDLSFVAPVEDAGPAVCAPKPDFIWWTPYRHQQY